MKNFFVSLFASLVAVLFAIWIEKIRMPKLVINAKDSVNSDNTYPENHQYSGERWKFFRLQVENKKFPKFFRWLPRQTAENCRGKIEIHTTEELTPLFSFMGRWSSTPEIPHIPHEAVVKIYHPDPVTLPVGEMETIDVFVKAESDDDAYCWNNESYLHNWRNPSYQLKPGEYTAKVTISTQNGVSFDNEFHISIADKIENTFIKEYK